MADFSRSTVVACKAVSGCVLLVSAIALSVMLAGSSVPTDVAEDTLCGYTVETLTDYRVGGADSNVGASYLLPVPATSTVMNVLLLVVLALYWDFVWLFVINVAAYWDAFGIGRAYFATIEQDLNWYRWVQWASHSLYLLAVLMVAGATNVFVMTLFVFVVLAGMFALSVNEVYYALPRGGSAVAAGKRMTRRVVYEAVVVFVALWLVYAVVTFVYAANTTAQAAFADSTLVWSAVLAPYLLYLVAFALVGVIGHTFLGWFSVNGKELYYEAFHFVFVMLVTWIIAGFALSECPPSAA